MLCCRLDGAGWVMEWSGVETDLKVKMRHGKEFYQYWDFGEMRRKSEKVAEKAGVQNLDSQLLGLPAAGLKQFASQNLHQTLSLYSNDHMFRKNVLQYMWRANLKKPWKVPQMSDGTDKLQHITTVLKKSAAEKLPLKAPCCLPTKLPQKSAQAPYMALTSFHRLFSWS